jgi:ribonuclease BN (tRNA processing enzyme)
MKLRVLGSSGAEFPNMRSPAFLVDDVLLLDAGTIGAVLDEDEQWAIRSIFLTHTHLDHIKGIPFLADNIILKNLEHSVAVMSIPEVLDSLKRNLLNDVVWPDFTRIPDEERAVIRLRPIGTGTALDVGGYKVTAIEVNHSVPAVGYLVENAAGRRLLYTGDTGPTKAIWAYTSPRVHALIVEVSMPNKMEEMAILTGHLTPRLLSEEIAKMKEMPERILITHPKPQYIETLREELEALGNSNISMLTDGDVYTV